MTEIKTCPQCNNNNPSSNKFCQYCGEDLADVSEVSAPEELEQVPQIPEPEPIPPPEPPAYQPPPAQAPPPPQPGQWSPPGPGIQPPGFGNLQLKQFGSRKEGWVDVVPDLADKQQEVLDEVGNKINGLQKAGISFEMADISADKNMVNRRKCGLVRSYTGAVMTLLVDQYGKDLRVAWNLYYKATINKIIIGVLGGTALFLGLLTGLFTWGFLDNFFWGFLGWIVSSLLWLIPICILVMLAGRVLMDDFFALFFTAEDDFTKNDVSAMKVATHRALLQAVKNCMQEPEVEEDE